MEQKRTLWIAASAGVFLLIVIGAALILYSPSMQKAEPVQTFYNPASGWVNPPKSPANNGVQPIVPVTSGANMSTTDEPSGIAPVQPVENLANSAAPVKVENVTVITDNALVYGTGTTTTIDLNSLKSNPSAAASVIASSITETIKEPQSKEVVKTAVKEERGYEPPPKPVAQTPKKEAAPAKTVAKTTSAKTASKPAAKTTAKQPEKPAAPVPVWIQVGSYTYIQSANKARTALESNKIPSEVFTVTDAKGKLFYRVRVGPYTTKSEAEYWLKRINTIDEFAGANCYITSK